MNTTNLLATKFYIPASRVGLVVRPRLLEGLQRGLAENRKLTLISAPAGYGKSILVAEWIANLQSPLETSQSKISWLSLDESDNQPNRFFTYFVAALRQGDELFCADLFATLQSGQVPPPDVLVTALVNEMLAWKTPHFLVLDDFHHIQDTAILDALTALLTHQPPDCHLVLVTREDPPLPLARLRARGQLTEIRAADLRFSEPEAARLLQDGLHLELSAGDVARLTERTEGWVAGLHLAGVSLQGHENPAAFVQTLSGSHRFILDYLTEEAIKTQPPDVQEFLLKTSILSRLSGDLCEAVTGRTNSARLLEDLLTANLFIIPLDDEGRWYRYHHLFAELLQHKARRECADCLPDLHQRASLWHESQGNPGIAIEHGLQASDFERVAMLMARHHWDLINQGYGRAMETWLQSIPMALLAKCPQIYLSIVWGQMLRGDFAKMEPYLEMAQSSLASLPPDTPETCVAWADMYVLQSTLAQVNGRLAEALELAEKARALIPPDDLRLVGLASLAFGAAYRLMGRFEQAHEHLLAAIQTANAIDDHTTAMVSMAHLSLLLWPLGRLRYISGKIEQSIARAESVNGIAPLMIGAVHAVLGQVYYEWDRIAQARELLQRGIHLATLSGHSASLVYGKVHLARLYQGVGDMENAALCLREADDALNKNPTPGWVRPDWLAQKVSLLITQGNLKEAESALKSAGIPAEAPVTYRTDVIHLAWLRWMIASRHPDAFSLAERIVHSAESDGRNGTLIHALVLGARAGGGAEWLARARQLGEPEGYQRVFLDEADEKMQDEFGRMKNSPSNQASGDGVHPSSFLISSLTERELEVLHLLVEGLTYAQMAERLVVSVNTVRYHVKGVYGKLGVEKQVQAVERGRELGLI
jgi:LuxR family transcriptional regulator, maltose regulon positive regulatory protein